MLLAVDPEDLAANGGAIQSLGTDVGGAGASATTAIGSAEGAVGDGGLAGALAEAGSAVGAASKLASLMLGALGRNAVSAGGAYTRTDGNIAGGMAR